MVISIVTNRSQSIGIKYTKTAENQQGNTIHNKAQACSALLIAMENLPLLGQFLIQAGKAIKIVFGGIQKSLGILNGDFIFFINFKNQK